MLREFYFSVLSHAKPLDKQAALASIALSCTYFNIKINSVLGSTLKSVILQCQ